MESNKGTRIISNDFGMKLKMYRHQKGFTFKDLSQATGISEAYLNKLETGVRKCPSVVIVDAISTALGVNFDTLIGHISEFESTGNSLQDILESHTFLINGKSITSDTKTTLIEILNFIFSQDTDFDKVDDVAKLINYFILFRKSI